MAQHILPVFGILNCSIVYRIINFILDLPGLWFSVRGITNQYMQINN